MIKETLITLTGEEIKNILYEYCSVELNVPFDNLEIDTILLDPVEDEWENSSSIRKIIIKLT